jgi:ribosomal protein L3
MGGLRRFAVLKKLEFDYHLLVDLKAQADEATIADLHPPSIEDIHFHGLDTSNMKTVRRLIGQLTDAKVDMLPVLRKLSLVTQARSSEVVKKVVEAVVEEDSEDEDEEMSEGEADEQSDGEENEEIDGVERGRGRRGRGRRHGSGGRDRGPKDCGFTGLVPGDWHHSRNLVGRMVKSLLSMFIQAILSAEKPGP